MTRLTIFLLLTGCAFTAHADTWTGQDKLAHALAGAAVGGLVASATGDEWKGCAASALVGAAKEAYDYKRPGHQSSFKDFAVTAAAGCFAGVVVTPTSIFWSRRF